MDDNETVIPYLGITVGLADLIQKLAKYSHHRVPIGFVDGEAKKELILLQDPSLKADPSIGFLGSQECKLL